MKRKQVLGENTQIVYEYIRARPGVRLATAEVAEAVGMDPKNVSSYLITIARRDRKLTHPVRGSWVYADTARPITAAREAAGEIFETIATTSDGGLILKSTAGMIVKAVRL